MKVIIDNQFYFNKDNEYEYTLFEKQDGITKNGTPKADALIGHYSKLPNLIKRVIEVRLSRKKAVYDLRQFLNEYTEEVSRIEKLLSLPHSSGESP